MTSAATPSHDPLAGGGEMGALMRSIDWSNTAVGPVASWPQSLRTALSILLETGFPMYIAWGADFTQFYNDGYRPILGSTKHPAAMGISTRQTFAEIWDIIGPMFREVMNGHATTVVDFMLPLDRHGFAEECYFVFSYSPIREESGAVGGVLVTVTETTARVLGARRVATLQTLAADTRDGRSAGEACEIAARVLAVDAADLPYARIYLLDRDRQHATLAGAAGVAPGSIRDEAMISLDDPHAPWPLRDVVESRIAATVEPARGGDRVVVLPIMQQGGDSALGLLVAAVSPRLLLDDEYRTFLSLVAAQIASAIASAQALQDAKSRADALAELDRAKTTFFSNVSHEFRTPLTLLLGPIEDALAEPAGNLTREQLSLVHRNAQRLLRLVNTLLDFSRIEAGRAQASFEPTDIATLTREIGGTFRSLMENAGLQFEIDCKPVSAAVYVDRTMWEQVVLNLLSNAFKFTFAGRIVVSLRETAGGVELRVKDTGTGIPAAELPHLFDRFRRIEGARSRSFEGSGIGLALVMEIVRMHGGTIRAESQEGLGTTFVVTLPTGSGHLAAENLVAPDSQTFRGDGGTPFVEEARRWIPAPETVSEPIAGGVTPAGVANPGAHVLVVDDNADMRDYLRHLLEQHWQVETVPSGAEALAAAAARSFDLVVTDVMMPEIDGFELLRRLRAEPTTCDLPVIILSARAGEEARVEGLRSGADDYVVKPFGGRELVARVGTQIELSRLRRETRQAAESANRAKDEFLAMLGHELRNPLAPILTALQLMTLRGDVGAEKERAIIDRQVRHVVRLVDDLLDVSRITRGKIDLKREHVELAHVVARAIEMASPLIEQRQHDLRVSVPQQGLAIDGDPARLQQVLLNLLTNAAKYTEPNGRIAVDGRREGSEIVLRVLDNGIGIAADTLPRVFDLFTQERQALDRAQGGLGLGLTIVRRLVELHGGSVEARSEGVGRGSEFVVRLPISDLQAGPASRPAARERVAAPASGRMRILVVDDNADAASLLAQALERLGHETRLALDGPSALRAAAEFKPQIALLDLGLPVMDGYELAEHLREAAGAPKLIAVTGYGQESDRRRSRDSGFDAHIVKPVDLTALQAVIEQLRSAG